MAQRFGTAVTTHIVLRRDLSCAERTYLPPNQKHPLVPDID